MDSSTTLLARKWLCFLQKGINIALWCDIHWYDETAVLIKDFKSTPGFLIPPLFHPLSLSSLIISWFWAVLS